jgi:hypothetical protein
MFFYEFLGAAWELQVTFIRAFVAVNKTLWNLPFGAVALFVRHHLEEPHCVLGPGR